MMSQADFDRGYDGMHVKLTCENHPNLRWSCKRIALSLDKDGKYRYNHVRNIFFDGDVTNESSYEECDCPSSKLYALVEGHI